MKGAQIAGALLLCFVLWQSEAETPAVASPPSQIKEPAMALQAVRIETGRASWYGEPFQGRPTASGAPFNMYALTAAHRTLPLGSLVRVTNLRNHRSAILRINDRGPVPENVVLDVSYGTAQALNFAHQGIVPVRIELLEPVRGTDRT